MVTNLILIVAVDFHQFYYSVDGWLESTTEILAFK